MLCSFQFMMFQSKIKLLGKQHALDHGFKVVIIEIIYLHKYSFVDRFPAVSVRMRMRLHTRLFN